MKKLTTIVQGEDFTNRRQTSVLGQA